MQKKEDQRFAEGRAAAAARCAGARCAGAARRRPRRLPRAPWAAKRAKARPRDTQSGVARRLAMAQGFLITRMRMVET